MQRNPETFTYDPTTLVDGKRRPNAPKDPLVEEIADTLGGKLMSDRPTDTDWRRYAGRWHMYHREFPINGYGIGELHFERRDLDPVQVEPHKVIQLYTVSNPDEWLHTPKGTKILETIVEETKPLNRQFDRL